MTIDECFYQPTDRGNKLQNAEEWVRERLKGGSVESVRLFAEAKERGHADKTLRRALHNLKAETFQLPGKVHAGHHWKLPDGDFTERDLLAM